MGCVAAPKPKRILEPIKAPLIRCEATFCAKCEERIRKALAAIDFTTAAHWIWTHLFEHTIPTETRARYYFDSTAAPIAWLFSLCIS